MKKTVLFSAMAAMVLAGATSCGGYKKNAALKTDVDSVSYAFGVNAGVSIKQTFDGMMEQDEIQLNKNDFMAAFMAAFEGDSASLKISAEESMATLQSFGQKLQEKAMAKQQADAAVALEEGKKFLAEKEKEEGVKKTESGLLYKVVKAGKGASPKADSKVKVNYEGTLIDGTVFDSSYERNEPATFQVNQVIPGWTEGLQLMAPGAEYTFYIPSELAYGDRQVSEDLKANSVLIFKVELIEIEK